MEEAKATGTTFENLGVLDLIEMKPDDLAAVTLIQNVGVIIAPEALSGTLLKIPQKNVGLTVTIPTTSGKIKRLTGQLAMDGEAFANRTGSPDDILVVAGQVIITSGIETVGFKEVIVSGQVIAPKKTEQTLMGAVSRFNGQMVYYNGETPRLFVGDDTFSKAFFDYFDDRFSMVLVGDFVFDSDVDTATLKQKVEEVVLIGNLKAPKQLVPLLQHLAVVKLGSIAGIENAAAASEQ